MPTNSNSRRLWAKFKSLWSGKAAPQRHSGARRVLRARHEAIDADAVNANHWTQARCSSPNSMTYADREALRNKVRHERENSGTLDGLLQQYSGDFIGTGPRLQLLDETPGSESWTEPVSRLFAQWFEAIGGTEKLTTLVESEVVDGEAFLQLVNNPGLDFPIKLDLRGLEPEQVATPELKAWLDTTKIDGLEQDPYGNVTGYHVLREHPGEFLKWGAPYDVVPAAFVCHWFRPQRAGQGRGYSPLASTIETCGAIRRYLKATLGKQELSAHIAATLEVDAPPEVDAALEAGDEGDAFRLAEVIPIPYQGMLSVPKGSNPKTFETAQNTTGFEEYVSNCWTSVGRPILAPRNLITGDSSGFNFASGRLDHLPWQASKYRKRERLKLRALAKILRVFYAYALLAGILPANTPPFSEWVYDFHYDGFASIDAVKDADAIERRLKLGLTTLMEECAALGLDWRAVARQRAKERQLYTDLGLDPDLGLAKPAPAAASTSPAKASDQDQDDEALEDTRLENAGRSAAVLTAAATPSQLCLAGGEPVTLEAAADGAPDGPSKFNAIAYTGGVIKANGFPLPVVVDLAGLQVPNPRAPVLREHDPARPIGHSETVEVGVQRIKVAGELSFDGEDTERVKASAKKRYPWQTSIGIGVDRVEHVDRGQTVKVNGRNQTGPLIVVRASVWRELSFVTLGADSQTSAVIAAKHVEETEVKTFSEWLLAKGIVEASTPKETLDALRAAYKLEQTPAPTPTGTPAGGGTGTAETVDEVILKARAENTRRGAIAQLVATAAAAQPTKLDEIKAVGERAIAEKWDVERTEMKLLMASIPQAAPLVYSTTRDTMSGTIIEAAIAKEIGLDLNAKHYDDRVLEAAEKNFRHGIGLHEVIGLCASQHGFRGTVNAGSVGEALRTAFKCDLRANAGVSTYSISGILSNVLRKSVRENFLFVEREWPKIAEIVPVKDFKQTSTYSLTGDFTYKKIPAGGELKQGSFGEESYNNQADSYGLMVGVDRRDLINDDLGALRSLGKRLGRGGGLKLNDVIWTDVFLDNAGGTFFHADNGNYDTGTDTTFSNDGLVAADVLWRAMTDPDGKKMGHVARKVLVPSALRIPALRLMSSQSFGSADEEGIDNPWAGMFEVVSSRYLDGSPKVWYLLCDPNDIAVLQVCFLSGKEEPTIEDVDLAANQLGIAIRAYHDFGAALQEPRGGYKFKGEA